MKYKLTDETITFAGVKLHRIQALIDFANVKAGDLGGYVEKSQNLSQDGDAWVSGNAQVYGDAQVSGHAQVYGDAWVSGNARVYGDAWVSGHAQVYGNARVYGDAWVSGNAQVYGDAWVSGHAQVYGDAQVSGNARVYGHTKIESSCDFTCVGPIGSRLSYTTYLPKQDIIFCGCFSGSLSEFEAAVLKTHPAESQHRKDYLALISFFKALS